ncbi:MAG: DUF296 domain-containing protein [Bacillota bacterium]|nr:MAG: DUF296 domain-containing protein [Bacillota bacterium]
MPSFDVQRVIVGRMSRGDDILERLTAVAREEGILTGWVQLLGAVETARLAFYDQDAKTYREMVLDRPFEILSGTGNISLLKGDRFVHLHLTLGDAEGRAFGGHVLPGTRVFACEYCIWVLSGPALSREPDEETGLQLWAPGS